MKFIGAQSIYILLTAVILLTAAVGAAGAADPIPGPVALMYVSPEKVEFKPNEEYDGLTLTVTGPNDTVYTHDSNGREIISFYREDDCGNMFPDGAFTYELRVRRELSQEEMELIAAARLSCESLGIEEYKTPLVQTGTLSLVNGEVVYEPPVNPEEFNFGDPGQGRAFEDHLIYDDLIVTGSECIGFDCSNGESFGYDTLILKEHNLRIYFNDTSYTASYPTTSWRIEINSQNNGGGAWFAIQDVDEGTTPFKIEGKAPSSSLYVDDNGRVGFGTSSPVLELHVKDGDTPSLRLHQDASYGWDAQTWDVCGNESNFFIRDATNGSKLPFRIQPGAPSSSITIRDDGDVGIGTWSPTYQLDVHETDTSNDSIISVVHTGNKNAGVELENSNNTWRTVNGMNTGNFLIYDATNNKQPFVIEPNTPDYSFYIDSSGNVGIGDSTPSGKLDVHGSIYQSGGVLHADYVFEEDYSLESIEEHSEFMWKNRRLKAVPKAAFDENGHEVVEIGSHRKGILEELEKAHIYIDRLSRQNKRIQSRNKNLEERLARLEALLIENQ